MSSRHYLKRVWRVPKTSAAEYFAALVVKALVKHGWPAKAVQRPFSDGVLIEHYQQGDLAPDDFWAAVSIAVRIVARTHRVQVDEWHGLVRFEHPYIVTPSGHFKEAKS
ncbi:MAG: hypothetical protein CVT83_08050 [Alphaproteobacteria bacterium HGW-Alphaproteobacteria-5]|nr:MAG: hypothetical protein CVT83_08050 [Alphaproteobacteria bacterium HGW-Alphaproteobacteria-5]